MGRHDRADGMGFHDDRDSAIAELLRRAYARRVGIDVAARHLWVLDAAARSLRRSRHAVRARRALVTALTSLMLVATAGGAIAASGAALPGDALYPVKRGTERVRLVLAVTADADAQMHLAIARARWDEAKRAAADRPDAVPGLLSQMFAALDAAELVGGTIAERALALRTHATGHSRELAFGPPDPAAQPTRRTSAAREPGHLASPPASRAPAGALGGAAGDGGPADGVGAGAADGEDAAGGPHTPTAVARTDLQEPPPPPRAPAPAGEGTTGQPEDAPPPPVHPTPTPGHDHTDLDVDADQPAPEEPTPQEATPEDAAPTPSQPGPAPAGGPATEVEAPASSAPTAPGWGRPRP